MEFALWDIISVVAIAIGLAMDAFSVSIVAGITIEKPDIGHYARLSFHFGLFQFLMPLIGYAAGISVYTLIKDYDHWVAMIILTIIGVRMIRESFSTEEHDTNKDPSRGFTLVFLSIATSIDALAVGLSLGVLQKPILLPSVIIGVVCALFSVAGIYLGKRVGALLGKRAERIGGIILIIIGIKIVFEHWAA
jgi:putative Mn2+ efflux pump MntP